ncbi:MAG: Wzz/FepE/Etk N-terminal domain-containing protein, partial [Crocinitomicaceae bacterium]
MKHIRTNDETENRAETINLKEIWFNMVSNWKLFVFLFSVCLIATFLYLRYTTPLYEASIKIIIKDDENVTSGLSETSAFEDLKIMQFNNSIENEKSVITSRTIMANVVDSLNLDYIIKSIGGVTGLTKRDLYGISPISVSAVDAINSESDLQFNFNIKIIDENRVQLKNDLDQLLINARFGEKFNFNSKTGLIVQKTSNYNKNSIGKEYAVRKIKSNTIINSLVAQLEIDQIVSNGSILNISIKSPSYLKAIDLLNTLIIKYNDDVVSDKTLITKNTDKFINERVNIISNELEIIETNSKEFKERNKLTDIPTEAEQGIITQNDFSKNILDANVQLELGKLMLNYIEKNENTLLPTNLGLANVTIEKTIEIINKLNLEREEELKTATLKNPKVENLTNRIIELKKTITQSIENLITAKQTVVNEYLNNQERINTNL